MDSIEDILEFIESVEYIEGGRGRVKYNIHIGSLFSIKTDDKCFDDDVELFDDKDSCNCLGEVYMDFRYPESNHRYSESFVTGEW